MKRLSVEFKFLPRQATLKHLKDEPPGLLPVIPRSLASESFLARSLPVIPRSLARFRVIPRSLARFRIIPRSLARFRSFLTRSLASGPFFRSFLAHSLSP